MTTMHGTMDQAATPSATVRGWLRLEGAAAFAPGLAAYGWLGGPWLLVIPLLLLPDLSAVGYLRDPRVGAFTYNLVHNWAFGLGAARGSAWRPAARRSRSSAPSRSPTPAWIAPSATASSSRPPSTTPTSAAWAGQVDTDQLVQPCGSPGWCSARRSRAPKRAHLKVRERGAEATTQRCAVMASRLSRRAARGATSHRRGRDRRVRASGCRRP